MACTHYQNGQYYNHDYRDDHHPKVHTQTFFWSQLITNRRSSAGRKLNLFSSIPRFSPLWGLELLQVGDQKIHFHFHQPFNLYFWHHTTLWASKTCRLVTYAITKGQIITFWDQNPFDSFALLTTENFTVINLSTYTFNTTYGQVWLTFDLYSTNTQLIFNLYSTYI